MFQQNLVFSVILGRPHIKGSMFEFESIFPCLSQIENYDVHYYAGMFAVEQLDQLAAWGSDHYNQLVERGTEKVQYLGNWKCYRNLKRLGSSIMIIEMYRKILRPE